ncbi:MAG: tetratricopeptide repeat protein [Pseudomonadota bacterium]
MAALDDWLTRGADAIRWLADRVAPDLVKTPLHEAPDWVVCAVAPFVLLAAVAVLYAFYKLVRQGFRVLSGKAGEDEPPSKSDLAAMEARIIAAMNARFEEAKAPAPSQQSIQLFAANMASDPALADAQSKILAKDFAGATDAVRAVAEAESRARGESAAREAQLWRDLGLLESARSVAAAIEAYEKARTLAANDFGTLIYLSRLYGFSNSLVKAMERGQAALKTASDARERSIALDEIGDVLSARNDLEGALTNYRESLAIRKRLADADPSHGERQRDVSVSLDRIGDVLRARNDLEGALTNYRESLAIRKRLADADPSHGERQRDVSLSLERIGDVLSARNDLEGALTNYRESLAIRKRLADADPSHGERQQDVAVSCAKLAMVSEQLRRTEDACAYWRRAHEILQILSARAPDHYKLRQQAEAAGHQVERLCGAP